MVRGLIWHWSSIVHSSSSTLLSIYLDDFGSKFKLIDCQLGFSQVEMTCFLTQESTQNACEKSKHDHRLLQKSQNNI